MLASRRFASAVNAAVVFDRLGWFSLVLANLSPKVRVDAFVPSLDDIELLGANLHQNSLERRMFVHPLDFEQITGENTVVVCTDNADGSGAANTNTTSTGPKSNAANGVSVGTGFGASASASTSTGAEATAVVSAGSSQTQSSFALAVYEPSELCTETFSVSKEAASRVASGESIDAQTQSASAAVAGEDKPLQLNTLDFEFRNTEFHELPNLLVLDTSGYDQLIFNGARMLFKRGWRPVIITDFTPALLASHGACRYYSDLLEHYGYSVYMITNSNIKNWATKCDLAFLRQKFESLNVPYSSRLPYLELMFLPDYCTIQDGKIIMS